MTDEQSHLLNALEIRLTAMETVVALLLKHHPNPAVRTMVTGLLQDWLAEWRSTGAPHQDLKALGTLAELLSGLGADTTPPTS
jgi:hypothetical protein